MWISALKCRCRWYYDGMPEQVPTPSPETSQDPVEIPRDNAISIQEARSIASAEDLPIGKSTLQRWAKLWAEQGSASPVKSILVTTRAGSAYRLDRDDFTAWLLDQKQNGGSHEALQDPVRPQDTSRDPARSHEASQDPTRPREASTNSSARLPHDGDDADVVARLRDENMQLKIDLEVRKRLLSQAASEHERQRGQTEDLLRENGALQLQVRQLASGQDHPRLNIAEHDDGAGDQPIIADYRPHVDIPENRDHGGL